MVQSNKLHPTLQDQFVVSLGLFMGFVDNEI